MWLSKPPLGTPLDWKKPINKDLVLHLAMNEGHGDKVYDLSGYGNHGTLKNFAFPPTVDSGWNPGRKGVGLNFDGSNDYIDCGNNTSLDITDAITIEAWVKLPDGATGDRFIISKKDHYSIWVRYGTFIQFRTRDSYDELTYFINIADGKWHHITTTFDNSLDNNNKKIYLDGTLRSQKSITNTISATITDLIIGKITPTGGNYFFGTIDEVRVYRRALSAVETRERYINPWGVYLDEED